jgi:3-hydroxybutyryl-CoA dehydrogenase
MTMTRVGMLGAGTMGSGIAQVAAAHGCTVELADASPEIVCRAIDAIGQRLDRLVEKGQLDSGERDRIRARLRPAASPESLASCDLVLEAVSEDLDIKTKVLQPIAARAAPNTIFASNTSSLSITRLGRAIGKGRRMAGMHFFNPPVLMPLVEVIAGADSEPAVVEQVAALARSWGKTVVHAKDTPGFIVNRVARGYYLEALRILGEGLADIETIDRTMKQLGGFRLGPFELMDLVGIDVNYGVSTSVWEQLGRPARLTPHPIQAALQQRGQLGRKTQRGFYDYSQEPAVPAVLPHAVGADSRSGGLSDALREAATTFAQRASGRSGTPLEHYIFARILATIINEAALVFHEGVAVRQDIDTAMRLGTSYPHGPLEWAEQIGTACCGTMLLALNTMTTDDRFRPAAWLQS